jgi:hypothetical protein
LRGAKTDVCLSDLRWRTGAPPNPARPQARNRSCLEGSRPSPDVVFEVIWKRVPVIVRLGSDALNILKDLPSEGVLFPYLSQIAGYPERFAKEVLGHNSKAVQRAYAKKALMKIPSLQEYEECARTSTEVTA